MRLAFSTLFCRLECRAMLVEDYIDPCVFITHLTAVPPTEGHETAGKACFLLALLISSAFFLVPQFLHPQPLLRFCCSPYLGLWCILLETAGLEPRLDIPGNVETGLPWTCHQISAYSVLLNLPRTWAGERPCRTPCVAVPAADTCAYAFPVVQGYNEIFRIRELV